MSSNLQKAGIKIDYVDCDCLSSDHVVRFTYDDGDEKYEPYFSIEHQLTRDYGFWRRIIVAFRYIFGVSNNWECAMLNVESAEKIRQLIDTFRKRHKHWMLQKNHVCLHCEGQGGMSECNECGLCASCKRIDTHEKDCVCNPNNAMI